MSGVTDAYGKDAEYADKLKGACKMITCMLRTWGGSSSMKVNASTYMLIILHRADVLQHG